MRYALGVLLLGLLARPVGAYEEGGHFYTVTGALHAHQPAWDPNAALQERVVAFCAQLPDLAEEFDAITVRVRLQPWQFITWGLFSSCSGDEVLHMVGVQHYMHSLTGGSHADTLAGVESAVQRLRALAAEAPQDANRACALGMSVHALGDAFAHSRLDLPTEQYPTGLGHFRDQTKPDHPLFDATRYALYKTYVADLNRSLGVDLNPNQLSQFDGVGQPLLAAADSKDNWDESQLIGVLRDLWQSATAQWSPYKPAVEVVHQGEWILHQSCDSVLQQYGPALGAHVDCSTAWNLYMSVARDALHGVAPVCPAAAVSTPGGL